MAFASFFVLLAFSLTPILETAQAIDSQLVGTWSTKSRKVITGPGFYNPTTDTIIEPKLTGISYSFTSDGHYEEAQFRAISNPTKPQCPSAVVQWQHGTFVQDHNTSLQLNPISVDGRQLLSRPCESSKTILTRFTQNESFAKAEIQIDAYNGQLRLNLYMEDGTPVNPMWLEYSSPQMLPTTTLNPTVVKTISQPAATNNVNQKSKRNLDGGGHSLRDKIPGLLIIPGADLFFWQGVLFIGIGSVLFICA